MKSAQKPRWRTLHFYIRESERERGGIKATPDELTNILSAIMSWHSRWPYGRCERLVWHLWPMAACRMSHVARRDSLFINKNKTKVRDS